MNLVYTIEDERIHAFDWNRDAEGGSQERELALKYRGQAKRLAFDYPRVSDVLQDIANAYDQDAEQYDEQVQINKRLPH